MKALVGSWDTTPQKLLAEITALRSKVAELKAENEELRADNEILRERLDEGVESGDEELASTSA